MKKHKLTANTLALGNLKKHKKQYFTMIAGIILAMVFSSGTLFFISCLFSSMEEQRQIRNGNADYLVFDMTEDVQNRLDAQSDILSYGLAHILGFCYTEEQEDGAVLAWLDKNAFSLYYPVFIEGTWPETENEIAAEENALIRMGLENAKIGDALSLNLQVQNGPENHLPNTVEMTYVLSGILSDKRKYIGLRDPDGSLKTPALFTFENEKIEPGGRESLTAYMTLNKNASVFPDLTYMHFTQIDNELLDAFYDLRNQAIFPVVMSAVLMLASALGIINAFNSNLSERKKQIGLLRAVGATKRQIISIYGRESFLLSMISAPVSVLISFFGVKLTTSFMEDFIFLPSWWVLFGSMTASVLFVLLASLIPLAAAARVSPMQAIRNTELSRKMHKVKIKSKKQFTVSRLLSERNLRFYRLRTVLTSLILAVAIFISCYAFTYILDDSVNTSMFSDYYVGLSMDSAFSSYLNYTTNQHGYSENDKQALLSSPLVAAVNGKAVIQTVMTAENDSAYKRFINYCDVYSLYDYDFASTMTQERYPALEEHRNTAWVDFQTKLGLHDAVAISVVAQDEPAVRNLIGQNAIQGVNIEKLNAGEEVILVAPQTLYAYLEPYPDVRSTYYFQVSSEKPSAADQIELESAELDFHVGDEVKLTVVTTAQSDVNGLLTENYTRKDKTVRIGAIINTVDYTFFPSGVSDIFFITTTNGLRTMADSYKYKFLNVTMATQVTQELDAEMTRLIERVTSGQPAYVYSEFLWAQDARQTRKQAVISISAIVILMLSIAGSMINNALTARIREGKREIGTLRAVGANASELVRSYVLELSSMLGIGSGVGFTGFLLLWFGAGVLEWLQYRSTEKPVFERLSIWQTVIGVVLLFALCAFNLRRQIKRHMKNSVVENIREL